MQTKIRIKETPLIILIVFSLFILLSCTKSVKENQWNTTNNEINIAAIRQWHEELIMKVNTPMVLVYNLAQKRIIANKLFVRIPVQGSGGSFYFTKVDSKLQGLFIVDMPVIGKPLNGAIGFVDFFKRTFTTVLYNDNKPVAVYTLKSGENFFDDFVQTEKFSLVKKSDDACEVTTRVVEDLNGKITVIEKNGEIPCPGSTSLFQRIWNAIKGVFSGIGDVVDWILSEGGGNSDAFDFSPDRGYYSGPYASWMYKSFYGTMESNAWQPYDPAIQNGGIPPGADEPMPGVNDNDPEMNWWLDNVYDPNTNYFQQQKPSWIDVFNAYPKFKNPATGQWDDQSADDVYALLGGEAKALHISDRANYTNACALRISRALNYSGIVIPNIVNQTVKGADNKNYFLRPEFLKNWMTRVFGAPDKKITLADVGYDPSKFQTSLIPDKGIYLMFPKSASTFGASGHATLFLGIDCIHSGFYTYAKEIYFWKLN